MKNKKTFLLVSFVAVLILVSVSIFYTRNSNSNIFNFETLEVGQRYGDLIVKSIQPFSEKYKDRGFPQGLKLSRGNYSVEFQGETIVVGEYSVNDPEQAETSGVYFRTDGKKIPVESFLILNTDLTKNEFGSIGSKGKATIIIADYIKNSYPSEITNTARLVKVISREENNKESLVKNIYKDDVLNLTVSLPVGWIAKPYPVSSSTIFVNPKDFKFPDVWEGSLTPIQISLVEGGNIEEIANQFLLNDPKNLILTKEIIGGLEGIRIKGVPYDDAYLNGRYVESVYVRKNGRVLRIGYTDKDATPEYLDEFKNIVDNIKF